MTSGDDSLTCITAVRLRSGQKTPRIDVATEVARVSVHGASCRASGYAERSVLMRKPWQLCRCQMTKSRKRRYNDMNKRCFALMRILYTSVLEQSGAPKYALNLASTDH